MGFLKKSKTKVIKSKKKLAGTKINYIFASTLKQRKKMDLSKIVKGTKIECKSMVMVITGKSETAFLGYISHAGKAVGQVSLGFEMFENPNLQ